MSVKDRRPALFLSSTTVDLAEYRDVVVHVCQRLGIDLIVMEDFGPDPRTTAAVCREKIDQADLFLGLYAHRYGHTPDGFGGKSITELEYDWAREAELPGLLFLVDDEQPWPPKHIDKSERLEQFKARMREKHTVDTLTTPEQLKDDLFVHLPKFRDRAGERAPTAVEVIPRQPEPYIAHHYTLLQTGQVVGREAELASLDEWAHNAAGASVLNIVAIGGMGKSALTWKWFHDRTPQTMVPLAGRLWWSFYESHAGFDRFVISAVAYCSGRTPDAVQALSPIDRENQLLAILDRQPFLLVLDGLERLLIAYSNLDFAHLADEELDEKTANAVAGARGLPQEAGAAFIGQHRLRKTIDHRIGNFLRKLASVRAARILVTTRLYPSELQTVTGQPLPGTEAWFLRGMDPDDALALWRAMGVSGRDAELTKLFLTIDYYPLLIRALAGEVAGYRRAPGDFDAWRHAHPNFDPFALPLIQAKSHVLAHALGNLAEDARELLHTIAAFRSPIDYDTLTALFVERQSWPTQQLDSTLTQLEDRGLVGWDRRNNRYDLHPIVRGVVWSGLNAEGRREVYGALEEHFAAIPNPEDGVNTLAEATPVIELFNALVGLGRHDRAAEIYFDRLIESGNFSFMEEGLGHLNLAMLESLFPDGLGALPQVQRDLIPPVFSQLGHAYKYAGRIDEAARWYQRARESRYVVSTMQERHISLVALVAGRLREALHRAEVAETVGDKYDIGNLALCEGAVGRTDQAHARLSAQGTEEFYNPDFYRAYLHAWEGEYAAAAAITAKIIRYETYSPDKLAMIALFAEARMNLGDTDRALALLGDGLRDARRKGLVENELEHLRVLAELHRRLGDLAQARAFLDDLWDPAARGPFRLITADAYNVLAKIERDYGNREAAIAAAREAHRHAWCDGPPYAYHWGLEQAEELLGELGAESEGEDRTGSQGVGD